MTCWTKASRSLRSSRNELVLRRSVHSMADALLDWFTALQSPVIPEKCTSRLEKGEKINSEFIDAFMNMVWMRVE